MKFKKLLLPLSSLSVGSILAFSFISSENDVQNKEILTFHNLPEEFYNLTNNREIKRILNLQKEDLLISNIETHFFPAHIDDFNIYYDAGFENTHKLLENTQDDREYEYTYDENIDFNNTDAQKIKNSNMRYKRLDVRRNVFSFDYLENVNSYKNGYNYEYTKHIIRDFQYKTINLNSEELKGILTSEFAIVPSIPKWSYYGWNRFNSESHHIHNGYNQPISYVPIHFNKRIWEKTDNFQNQLNNYLINKANQYLQDNEEILVDETNFNIEGQILIKPLISSDVVVWRSDYDPITKHWEKIPYQKNMVVYTRTDDPARFYNKYYTIALNLEFFVPNISFVVLNKDNQRIADVASRYERAFNKAKDKLKDLNALNIINENLGERTLYSETNQNLLDAKINKLNETLKEFDFFVEYKVIDESKIDIFLSNKTDTLIPKSFKLASNYPVKITPSVRAINKDVSERLIIKTSKWVDFQTNTTELVDDVPVLLEKSKRISDKKVYGGKWLYHSPASVDFTTIDENEVLMINDKRIEVLDRHFSEILTDDKLIIDRDTKEDENSVREYKIKILKFKKNSGNTEDALEYEYTIDLLINSNALSIDYKFYASDPENNPDQKKLITEFKEDANGELLQDENGNHIKNEFYDPEIDKNTGTKKQLVWVDVSANTEILANDSYSLQSALPYGTKTLLLRNGSQLIKGFIAEASVLGSGSLQMINGETQNGQYRVFKLNRNDLTFKDRISYEIMDNGKKYKDLPLLSSENSYFSDTGLYLFTAHAASSIDNYKLVLIDKRLNAQKTKFVETINGLARINDFWDTPVGSEFIKYLKIKHNISAEKAKTFSYELVMQYFVLFTNYIFKLQHYTNNTTRYIDAFFKAVPNVYSYDTFKNKYVLSENGKELFYKDYAGDFENKELVKINNIQISADRNNLILSLGLAYNSNKNIFNYELTESVITIPISFIDNENNSEMEEIINARKAHFNLNVSKIEDALLIADISQWENLNIPYSWLKDIDLDDYNKGYWYLKSEKNSEFNYKITICGVVKNEFKSELAIVPKSKSFNLNLNKKMINYEIDLWESRIRNTSINLAGINDVNKIKDFITNQVALKMQDLSSPSEYQLVNLDLIAPFLVNINLASDKPLFYKVLEIRRNKDNKRYKISIFNYVDRLYSERFDLSEIETESMVFDSNNKGEIYNQITEKVAAIAQKRNINFSDLNILNIEDVIYNLLSNNKSTYLIVGSNHFQLINTFKVKLQNEFNFALKVNEETLNERDVIDLSKLEIPMLTLKDARDFNAIKDRIITYITNFLSSYNLFWNYDYYIENINNPSFLKQLVLDLDNTLKMKIKSMNKKSINETSFVIRNILASSLSEEELKNWDKANADLEKHIKENGGSSGEESIENRNYKDGKTLTTNEDLNVVLNLNITNLNDLRVAELITYFDSATLLKDAIVNHINSNLEAKYHINQSELNYAIKTLLIPNKVNQARLIIRGLYGFSKGMIVLNLTNTTTDNASYEEEISIKNDDNIIKIIKIEKQKTLQAKERKSKIITAISVSFSILIAAILGFVFWVRRFKHKLK